MICHAWDVIIGFFKAQPSVLKKQKGMFHVKGKWQKKHNSLIIIPEGVLYFRYYTVFDFGERRLGFALAEQGKRDGLRDDVLPGFEAAIVRQDPGDASGLLDAPVPVGAAPIPTGPAMT